MMKGGFEQANELVCFLLLINVVSGVQAVRPVLSAGQVIFIK
jgi:hypothetical protein